MRFYWSESNTWQKTAAVIFAPFAIPTMVFMVGCVATIALPFAIAFGVMHSCEIIWHLITERR